jgi:hypothetical protein
MATFLVTALHEDEVSASRLFRFTPREKALSIPGIIGWVGPRFGQDSVKKRTILLCRTSNPDFQLVPHCYTD